VDTGSNDVDEIYRRMAVIRRERHQHVSESVAGAEAVMDMGRFTWTYPWIALGAAAVVGSLVYTGSRPWAMAEPECLADRAEAVESVAGAGSKAKERSRNGLNLLLGVSDFLFPIAVRAGQNCMRHWLEQLQPVRTVGRTDLSPSVRGTQSANYPVER
jgi:hypothetical protein